MFGVTDDISGLPGTGWSKDIDRKSMRTQKKSSKRFGVSFALGGTTRQSPLARLQKQSSKVCLENFPFDKPLAWPVGIDFAWSAGNPTSKSDGWHHMHFYNVPDERLP